MEVLSSKLVLALIAGAVAALATSALTSRPMTIVRCGFAAFFFTTLYLNGYLSLGGQPMGMNATFSK